jgi:ring-1,2-phenylacetyl-CoA epoxidase subunit PaaD
MVTGMQTNLPSVKEVWNWLDAVSDPEIPVVSIVDLGMVRNVRWIEEDGDPTLVVTITTTYSGCPATAVIKEDIRQALQQRGLSRVQIETRLSPAWTTDWMTDRGRHRLLEYGIAPPEPREQGSAKSVPCPRCSSADTRLVSQFGSTPCKAFYICNSCLEPFDHFKCH